MAGRVGKSFADLIVLMQQLAAGMAEATDDPKQVEHAKELNEYIELLKANHDTQEKAKAAWLAASAEQDKNEAIARLLVGRKIAYLESEYGKDSVKLPRYGIARRQRNSNRKKSESETDTTKKKPEPAGAK